jgi:hypothetical protein
MYSVPKANKYNAARLILIFFCVCMTHLCVAQRGSQQKLSPLILKELKSGRLAGKLKLRIAISGYELPKEISNPEFNPVRVGKTDLFSFFLITASVPDLLSKILPLSKIMFVDDGARIPKEELLINNLDLAANKINLIHRKYPQWNGDGIVVSVKENKPDTADIDFKDRFLTTNLSSNAVSSHASIMSTMIAGGGNTWHLGKGAAWGTTISSSDFSTLLPDANSAYQQYNISVQNHSYGVGVESFYGADAAAYDASAISNTALLHVFSSGNSGTSSATTGTYAGLPGFANVTGSFKMAKNIITVGATDSFGIVATLSSKGPAHDGRVKPELVAFGEDGSSGAAALVSGTALVLQHAYKQLYGSLPSNALIKAILINSADDVGNKEVDYSNGYGSLNACNAIKTLQMGRYMNGSVSNTSVQTFPVSIPTGIKKLKLTLVWNDPPAAPNADKALVNDLDIELLHPLSGQSWQPWVLNKFPHIDSLQQLAIRKRDSLNNIEQITLEYPVAGNYQFRVVGYKVNTASQTFFLAYEFDSTDLFEWHFPTANDFVFSGSPALLQWNSTFSTTSGKIEFSIDNGINWQTIDNTADLTKNYYYWNAPSTISKALLRMNIDAQQFVSDTFTISQRTTTGVGFNCPDSFLFYWNKIPGINTYRVYKLGSKYLESLFTTTDSFVVLDKINNPSLYYAIAPVISNREGVKSYTFNYTLQGVECYIRSFIGSVVNNSAQLDLLLGTLYNIDKIALEKFDGNSFITLQQLPGPISLQMSFLDNQLKKGLNIYRVRLELNGGKIIYADPQTIYYFLDSKFIIYPNPAKQNQNINVLSANTLQNTVLQILNIYGQKVYESVIADINTSIPSGRFSKGLYFFRFIKEDGKNIVLKVLIQ